MKTLTIILSILTALLLAAVIFLFVSNLSLQNEIESLNEMVYNLRDFDRLQMNTNQEILELFEAILG